MKDITIIIPIHEYDEQIKDLLVRSIKSVPNECIIHVIAPYNFEDKLHWLSDEYKNITVFTATDKNESTDFCTLVNRGVSTCDTKWFSILEFDDEYTDIWFKNVEKYIEYKPDVSVLLPLEELNDFKKNTFVGYGNEAPWASSFSSEIGYIDNDCLQQFFDFYLTGGVFNTEDWLNQGGLKTSIKVTFWYEFLLRLTNNNKQVFVIPKLGYKHYVDRENSLYDVYRKTVDEKESSWWFELAKQEQFYKNDRNKTYENREEKEGC